MIISHYYKVSKYRQLRYIFLSTGGVWEAETGRALCLTNYVELNTIFNNLLHYESKAGCYKLTWCLNIKNNVMYIICMKIQTQKCIQLTLQVPNMFLRIIIICF